jgi:hypothetical protein
MEEGSPEAVAARGPGGEVRGVGKGEGTIAGEAAAVSRGNGLQPGDAQQGAASAIALQGNGKDSVLVDARGWVSEGKTLVSKS